MRLTFRQDPSTTAVIGWDQEKGESPILYYGLEDKKQEWKAYPYSHKPDRMVFYMGMHNYFARLTNLLPDTTYYFVIKDSEGISARYQFRTFPTTSNTRLSIIAGGDSRNNRTTRRNANLIVSLLEPDLVLFGGDMTNLDMPLEWQRWLEDWQLTITSQGRLIPILATRGNHELRNESIYHLFDTPSEEIYYALNFAGNLLRVYTLNTEISVLGKQRTWLEKDLQAHSSVWKIVQYHRPIAPHAPSKPFRGIQYRAWASLFYQYGVDLIVECDAHVYKLTYPLRPDENGEYGFVRDDARGNIYIGEGGWGAPLRNTERKILGWTLQDQRKSWTRDIGSFNHFHWIWLTEKTMQIRTVLVDNAPLVCATTLVPAKKDKWFIPPKLLLRVVENQTYIEKKK
ncbi:MAG: metallophosphoesterase family protein [Bacteroidia bacterium]|nr:metallophosphoesterase family protein [Bacteroidia bacterium]MDW8158809.1 metallophosphoesterase family protein [Bacteroidia bacterium]